MSKLQIDENALILNFFKRVKKTFFHGRKKALPDYSFDENAPIFANFSYRCAINSS